MSLIDYGIAEKYLDETGHHIAEENERSFSGNKYYCSVQVCRGYKHSRRDDIQALAHIFSFILNGTLPWDRFMSCEFEYFLKTRIINEYNHAQEIIDAAPHSLKRVFFDTFLLCFKDKPPYDKLIQCFEDELNSVNNKKSISTKG